MSIENVLYRAHAEATGGRAGRAVAPEGGLDLKLTRPKGLGGKGEKGTNPEELFAAGYSAGFIGAMQFDAARDKISIAAEVSVNGTVAFETVPNASGTWTR